MFSSFFWKITLFKEKLLDPWPCKYKCELNYQQIHMSTRIFMQTFGPVEVLLEAN